MSTRPSGSEETEPFEPQPGDEFHFFVKITTNDGTSWHESDVTSAFRLAYTELTRIGTYRLEVTRIAIVDKSGKSWM